MYFSYDKLYSIILDYINDPRYKQAILIDGDWGVGKSYFVTHNLIDKIKNSVTGDDNDNKRKLLYVSLYGIESCTQILNELCTQILATISSSEKINKGIGFAAKIASIAMSTLGIDPEKLPIADITNFKNAVIIFDDLERCGININEILGFINNLVEHNDIKVIIVANQKEIGKLFLTENLPQKYTVVLNPRLKMNQQESEQKPKALDSPITEEDLKKYTELLFANDILYDKIKEKLIGATLHFMPDFNLLFDDVVKEYVLNEQTKNFVTSKKTLITSTFINKSYYNLRTLIFALMCFEKIHPIICKLEFETQYLDGQSERILNYCIHLAIHIKTGGKPYTWKSGAKTGITIPMKGSVSASGFITGYKFVDDLILRYELNHQEIKDCISELIQQQIDIDKNRKQRDELHLNKLYSWWELEDSEVYNELNGVLQDLHEDKYLIRDYKDIIVRLFQMEFRGFVIDKTKYIELMSANIQKMQGDIDPFVLEILSDDQKLIEAYNELMEPIFSLLKDKKSIGVSLAINACFDNERDWGNAFYEYCVTHKSNMLSSKEFFSTIDLEKLISALKISDLENIYGFLSGIKEIYSFSNLQDFFISDIEALKEFDSQLTVVEWANESINKGIAFTSIKEKIGDVIKILS